MTSMRCAHMFLRTSPHDWLCRGEDEMGSVLLGLSSELLKFNFRETL